MVDRLVFFFSSEKPYPFGGTRSGNEFAIRTPYFSSLFTFLPRIALNFSAHGTATFQEIKKEKSGTRDF